MGRQRPRTAMDGSGLPWTPRSVGPRDPIGPEIHGMEEVRGSNPLSSTASISRPGGTFAPWPVFVGAVSGRDLGQSLASYQFGSRLPAQTPRVAHGSTGS